METKPVSLLLARAMCKCPVPQAMTASSAHRMARGRRADRKSLFHSQFFSVVSKRRQMTLICDTCLAQVPCQTKRHTCLRTPKLGGGAMATTIGVSSEHHENPDEFQQDQSVLIRNFLPRTKELQNKLRIMRDSEDKPSTYDHDKIKPTDIKDIERPDQHDNPVAKFKTWFDKFKDLPTRGSGN